MMTLHSKAVLKANSIINGGDKNPESKS